MIIIPYYNIVIVPGIDLYFQSGYFKEITQAAPEAGKVVTLLMLKENKQRENMREDDFYPIGITGTIEAVSSEGNVKIRTEKRVNIETINVTSESIEVTGHYMNVPYDLSDVLFVCTANTTDTIQEPLLNRMEVIQFPGYTASEKFQIAKKHLLPRAMDEMGLKKENLKISDTTLRAIISDYTMEAGVRGLKKRLDTLCREAAVRLVKGKIKSISVTTGQLEKFLGLKPILHDHILEQKKPGVVTGLAWTQAGGDILFIEALFTKGKRNIIITGQLGDVMKESVQIAVSRNHSHHCDHLPCDENSGFS